MDRRKRKTQRAITAVFYQLLAKKSYEDISVSQICQVADINRGTFYLHFSDKDDLLKQSIAHEIQDLVVYCEGDGQKSDRQKIEKTFEYITEHRQQLSQLLRADKQGFFAQSQINYLLEQMTEQSHLTGIFFAHGLVGLWEHYLNNAVSEAEITGELERIMYSLR